MIDHSISALGQYPTAAIADAQDRFGVPTGIAPMWRGAQLAGRAITVETRPGDNLFVHKAIANAPAGAVLVINGFGDVSRALIGDLIATTAVSKALSGFVIDGAVRDIVAIEAMGLPVFARAVTAAGPYKTGPGRLNVSVAIGGVVVSPGDIVVGDTDGIVCVQWKKRSEVLERTKSRVAEERTKRLRNAHSTPNQATW